MNLIKVEKEKNYSDSRYLWMPIKRVNHFKHQCNSNKGENGIKGKKNQNIKEKPMNAFVDMC